jgi:hypothetical protein
MYTYYERNFIFCIYLRYFLSLLHCNWGCITNYFSIFRSHISLIVQFHYINIKCAMDVNSRRRAVPQHSFIHNAWPLALWLLYVPPTVALRNAVYLYYFNIIRPWIVTKYPHTPTNAHDLYKFTNNSYTWNLLHVSAIAILRKTLVPTNIKLI